MGGENHQDQKNDGNAQCQRYICAGKAGDKISDNTAGSDRHCIRELGGNVLDMVAPGTCAR